MSKETSPISAVSACVGELLPGVKYSFEVSVDAYWTIAGADGTARPGPGNRYMRGGNKCALCTGKAGQYVHVVRKRANGTATLDGGPQ